MSLTTSLGLRLTAATSKVLVSLFQLFAYLELRHANAGEVKEYDNGEIKLAVSFMMQSLNYVANFFCCVSVFGYQTNMTYYGFKIEVLSFHTQCIFLWK